MEVWDIKEWLKERIEDIHAHTRPHHFKFMLVDGQTEVKYKHWSDDPEWLPDEKSEAESEDKDESGPLHILNYPCVPIIPPDQL